MTKLKRIFFRIVSYFHDILKLNNLEEMRKVHFAELRKASKIDFSSSGSELSLMALARAERHESMLYFGWNCFSSVFNRPSCMRKKFRMLLICWKFNFILISGICSETYAILVLAIFESFFEELLSNGFSLCRLSTD